MVIILMKVQKCSQWIMSLEILNNDTGIMGSKEGHEVLGGLEINQMVTKSHTRRKKFERNIGEEQKQQQSEQVYTSS